MRLVGGDDGEDGVGAGDRLGRARRADHLRPRIVGALRRPDGGVGRVGLDVVGRDGRGEAGFGAKAREERLGRLAEADEGDRARRGRIVALRRRHP